jgi:hypothetical protein
MSKEFSGSPGTGIVAINFSSPAFAAAAVIAQASAIKPSHRI